MPITIFIGYKVVRRTEEGELVSCTNAGRVVTYHVQQVTRPWPGCGPLTVFDSLDAATAFAKDHLAWSDAPLAIFECQYDPSPEDCVWAGSRVLHIDRLPAQSRVARSVTLTQQHYPVPSGADAPPFSPTRGGATSPTK